MLWPVVILGLEKHFGCVEPFRIALRTGQSAEAWIFIFLPYKIFKNEILSNFSSHLLLILSNVFFIRERKTGMKKKGEIMLPNFGMIVIFLFS